jgi:hypothetical protein
MDVMKFFFIMMMELVRHKKTLVYILQDRKRIHIHDWELSKKFMRVRVETLST